MKILTHPCMWSSALVPGLNPAKGRIQLMTEALPGGSGGGGGGNLSPCSPEKKNQYFPMFPKIKILILYVPCSPKPLVGPHDYNMEPSFSPITPSFSQYDLTHCSRETRKRVSGKQCRPRSDAAEQKGLHCLQIV